MRRHAHLIEGETFIDDTRDLQTVIMLFLAIHAALAARTVQLIYEGGRTRNDHFVAALAALSFGCDMALAWGFARGSPLLANTVMSLFLFGGFCRLAMFETAVRGKDPGSAARWWLVQGSQFFLAFSFWTLAFAAARLPRVLESWEPLAALQPGPWLAFPLALSALSAQAALGELRTARFTLARLPEGAMTLRIVHLSDLHAGPFMPQTLLEDAIHRAMALRPQLVLLTGDYVVPFSEKEHQGLLQALTLLKVPTLACPGNHDKPILDRLRTEFEALGIPLLVDEQRSVEIEGTTVEVLGLDMRGRALGQNAIALLQELTETPRLERSLRVLLSHDPAVIRLLPQGVVDLALAGHHHGGLLSLDMLGLRWSPMRLFGHFTRGLYHRGGNTLIVSSGIARIGLPPRMGSRPEIGLIEIVARSARKMS